MQKGGGAAQALKSMMPGHRKGDRDIQTHRASMVVPTCDPSIQEAEDLKPS